MRTVGGLDLGGGRGVEERRRLDENWGGVGRGRMVIVIVKRVGERGGVVEGGGGIHGGRGMEGEEVWKWNIV